MINIFTGYIMKLPNEKAFKEQTARGKLISCLLLVKEKDRLKEKGFIYLEVKFLWILNTQ